MTVARLRALDTSEYEAKSWFDKSGWSSRGEALAGAVLHESGEAGQDAYGRVYALLRQIAREDYLPLGDVAREVGYGVRDVVAGHGQYGHERDGARLAVDEARALVDAGKI